MESRTCLPTGRWLIIIPPCDFCVMPVCLRQARFHAMFITMHGEGSYSYLSIPSRTPYVFQEKMYFMPIPQSEIEKNPRLVQNQGW